MGFEQEEGEFRRKFLVEEVGGEDGTGTSELWEMDVLIVRDFGDVSVIEEGDGGPRGDFTIGYCL